MSFLAEHEAAEAKHVPHWRLAERDVTDSLAGTHQLHRFVGRWSGGAVGEWAVLTDKATGEALLDMSGVKSGSAVWRADGCLLVRLTGRDNRLLVVDTDLRTFRHIGYDEAPRPVAELQAEVGRAARQVGADGRNADPDDSWLERDFGPDGRVMVEYFIASQRMSHETRTPRITDVATGEVLLRFDDSLFDGSVHFVVDGKLHVHLRHYSSGAGMGVEIDPGARNWRIMGPGGTDLPLATISKELPRQFRKRAEALPKSLPPPAKASPAAYGVIFGALLLIAIFGYSFFSSQPAPQKLTPLPTFPVKR